jgi:hypothetical protein
VEHALAQPQVVAALVAEADGTGAGFDETLRLRVEAAAACPLPAWATARSCDMGEGIAVLTPLRPPQRFSAGHGCLFLDMILGQLGDEAARDAAGPLTVDAAVGGVEDERLAPRAGDGNVGEAAFLLE